MIKATSTKSANKARLMTTSNKIENGQSLLRNKLPKGKPVPRSRIRSNITGINSNFKTTNKKTNNKKTQQSAIRNHQVLIHQAIRNGNHKLNNIIDAPGPTWHSTWPHWYFGIHNPKATYITQVPPNFMNNPEIYGAQFSTTCSLVNKNNNVNCYPCVVFPNGMRCGVISVGTETHDTTNRALKTYTTQLLPFHSRKRRLGDNADKLDPASFY